MRNREPGSSEAQGKFVRVSDYFAELYVAGRLADAGWNIYFPHRDQGFDFIITKYPIGVPIIRPVQVKGKYPRSGTADKDAYGYTEELSELHDEMVLAIPYFSSQNPSEPVCVAYMPRNQIKPTGRGWRCQPATLRNGVPKPRRDYAKFFDSGGISLLEELEWPDSSIETAEKWSP
ncbi:MAG: hypothetical protein HYT79_05535 [Elusimicrobia bacterium]|nr:hypothetical protein [Elusimicrobiota bacterium]